MQIMGTFIEGLVNAKLRNMKEMNNVYEVGHVVKVKDYILEVSGLENVGFYERVVISNYSVGYVTSIKKNTNIDIYKTHNILLFCLT